MHKFLAIALLSSICFSDTLEAAFTILKGRVVDVSKLPVESAEQHYFSAMNAINQKRWEEAIQHLDILAYHFPREMCAADVEYYLGIAYAGRGQYEEANAHLSSYMQRISQATFFREAVDNKWRIAELIRQTPALLSGHGALALEIYDELIAVFPQEDICARALYGKGVLLMEQADFKESIAVLQTLIMRFPKHELAADAYLAIAKAYYTQSLQKRGESDLLELARINFSHFQAAFPQEERLYVAEGYVRNIAELNAQTLWKTACFYERLAKPEASQIYYRRIIELFPETEAAAHCRQRLARNA